MPRPKLDRPNYRLRKRGERWVVDWTEDGKPRSVSTRERDEPAAQRKLAQFVAGRDAPTPPDQPTIAEILDGYLSNRRGHVEAFDRLDFAARRIRSHIGNLRPEHLARRTYLVRRERDDVAPATILREGATLRAALKWAEREKWIDRAPYVELPGKTPPRERFLSRDEVDALLRSARVPHVRLFILLAVQTAARSGAILDLTWDRVDFDRRLINFCLAGRAETKKRRAIVPINDVLIGPLQEARQVAISDYVVEYAGTKIKSIRHAFDRAVERAGIAHCTRHDLRRTAASWLAMAGVSIDEIARYLGDTSEMVQRVYARFNPQYLRAAADALAGDVKPAVVKKEQA